MNAWLCEALLLQSDLVLPIWPLNDFRIVAILGFALEMNFAIWLLDENEILMMCVFVLARALMN